MSAPVEAVLFDYGHTLIHFDEEPHARLIDAYEGINQLLARQLREEIPAAHLLIDRVSKVVDAELQREYQSGREEEVEIASLYDAALRHLGFQLEPELIEQVMELEQEGWLGSIHVGPDVPATLKALRAFGLRLGVVSNAAYRPRLMMRQMASLGLLDFFDGVTFSSGIGLRKPNPAIYLDALEKLAVDPSRALFVGDRMREDVEGPKRLGMRAVLTREWRQEPDAGAADFVITRLGELPAIIERLRAGLPAADTYN